ncbi:MAG: cache domain-containing protein, partial [Methanothrix sp.]
MRIAALARLVALMSLSVLAAMTLCLASDQTASSEEVIALLDEAVAYVNNNGMEKALQEFNNPAGSFVRGDLYIFAYDFNETCLAHPINPELVGQTGLLDINDVDVAGREIALAKRGGGTMYIVFPNPSHEGKEELKQLYL